MSDWKHIDERFLEGRRRHVLEEYQKLQDLSLGFGLGFRALGFRVHRV